MSYFYPISYYIISYIIFFCIFIILLYLLFYPVSSIIPFRILYLSSYFLYYLFLYYLLYPILSYIILSCFLPNWFLFLFIIYYLFGGTTSTQNLVAQQQIRRNAGGCSNRVSDHPVVVPNTGSSCVQRLPSIQVNANKLARVG